jgi:small subunit ribosomal protein S6
MRDYELVLIVSPDLSSEKQKEQLEKVKKIITGLKGEVKKTEEWGKKQLAYPIRKNEMGYYFLWKVQLPEKSLEELNQKLRIEERLLRYLIVKVEKRRQDKKAEGKGGKKHGSTLT